MDFYSRMGERLNTLRLIAEGACELFVNDAQGLYRIAVQNEKMEAGIAFDTIGAALIDLRIGIRDLQMENTQEALRDKA